MIPNNVRVYFALTVVLANVPEEQGLQLVEDSISANVPNAQATHVELETAPYADENVPFAQGTQAAIDVDPVWGK